MTTLNDFIKVEYLESSGTQYFNSGINASDVTKLEAVAQFTDTNKRHCFCGASDNTNWDTFIATNLDNASAIPTKIFSQWGVSNYNGSLTKDTNKHTYSYITSTGVFTSDDSSVTLATSRVSISLPMYVFGTNKSGTLDRACYGKLYSLKMYGANDTLVRNFIPVVRKSDYEPGMYDTVNNVFYTNAGTGKFSIGKYLDVDLRSRRLPTAYTELSYIQSSGTQYIDTGVNPTDSHGYKTEISFGTSGTAIGTEQCPMGCMDAGNRFVGVYFGGTFKPDVSSQISAGWGTFVNYVGSATYPAGTKVVSSCNYKNDRKISFAGTDYKDITDVTVTGTISNTIYLFDRHYSSNARFIGKMYSCIITNGSEVVRNFIPALRNHDSVVGMYDTVTETFYTNAGTGTFTAGNVVKTVSEIEISSKDVQQLSMPKSTIEGKYQVVDYIESNKAGWIDVGLKYHSTMSIKGRFTRLGMGESGSVMFLSTTTTVPLLYFPGLNGSQNVDRYVWRRTGYSEQSYYYSFSDYPLTEEVYLDYDSDTLTLNGSVVKTGAIAAMGGKTDPYYSASNMAMFGMTDGRYLGYGRIYYCKIWDAGELVRNYVPVKRISDNVYGMYDLVEMKFYGNAGTGSFTGSTTTSTVDLPIWTKAPTIPSTYTQKSYLQSSGTQYIDTGLLARNNTEAETKCMWLDLSAAFGCGGLYGTSCSCYFGTVRANKYFGYIYAGRGMYQTTLSAAVNTDYTIKSHQFSGSQYYEVNGVKSTPTSYTDTFTSTKTIFLFGVRDELEQAGAFAQGGSMKIYYNKIWQNGVLVRDFVPAVRNSDSVAGMYDRVTDTFFTNAGTGTFTTD